MTYSITEIVEAFDRAKLIALDEIDKKLNDEHAKADNIFKLTILLNNIILVAELKKNLLKELNNKNGGELNE